MKLVRLSDVLILWETLSSTFQEILQSGVAFLPALLLILLGLALTGIILTLLRKYWAIQKIIKGEFTLLELRPPSLNAQSSVGTHQLFTLIHALNKRTFTEKLLGIKPSFSLELVSTKDKGIRYIIRTPSKYLTFLRKSLISYLPQIDIGELEKDYLSKKNDHNSRVAELNLENHFSYPLKEQANLETNDPIAYITGMMTKLSNSELIALQLVISPVKSREAQQIAKEAIRDANLMAYIEGLKKFSLPVFGSILRKISKLLFIASAIPLWTISNLVNDGKTPFPSDGLSKTVPYRKVSEFEKKITEDIYNKVKQPLFESSIRLLVKGTNSSLTNKKLSDLISSFSTFSTAGHQSLIISKLSKTRLLQSSQLFAFKHRLPQFMHKPILSISELANLYHFPQTNSTKTEDIVKMRGKQLPAPLALKGSTKLSMTFAQNTYGGTPTVIGLTEEERRRHVYILGATGTGKSTLLLSMIDQDLKNGKGLCLIDPHGDLAESVLSLIPENRVKDVIYFNPDDISYPIALNLLEFDESLTDDEKVRDQEFITESIISLFNKLYPDHSSRPRMEYILRNAIYTAFTTPNPTIFTIFSLLVDAPFRRKAVKELEKLPDKNLYNFWKYEFNKAGDYQKVSMIMPITNKIGRFQFSQTARRILEQQKSKIDFEDIMNSGKILVCNVSKGKLGEDISEMFGILLLTKLQLAALKRARTKATNRKDFYLYVDEFQNFATPAFAQILSEARKYRLNAVLAHQTVSQIEDHSLVNVTLANSGTIICFRTANPIDEELILPQFAPYVEQGEIANLPSYHFYMKIAAVEPYDPFSGQTTPVEVPPNDEKVTQIIESSRSLYAKDYQSEQPVKVRTQAKLKAKKAHRTQSFKTRNVK